MSSRAIAVSILDTLCRDQSNLRNQLENYKDHKDISFIRALCYGCCRWHTKFAHILDLLLDKHIKNKDSDIKQLLILGLYEIEYMDTATYAVVSETVKVCEELNKQWAKGFVNAILRNYLRNKDKFTKHNKEIIYSHPNWFFEQVKKDWPDNWVEILNANNQQAPMTLRVNLLLNTRKEYMTLLEKDNINASFCKYSHAGIILSSAVDIDALPGFKSGLVSVQDEAAQFAAKILVTKKNSQVLDACAAPGGKTAHLYEENNQIKLLAIEKENKRLALLKKNLERLNINIDCKLADACKSDEWNHNNKFDHILLDAPCSASGIIRRQPDIKLQRKLDNVKNTVRLQNELLTALWSILKTDGTLLYATCSIFNMENRDQIRSFMKNNIDAELIPINLNEAVNTGFGYQILPDNSVGMDGFFYALLKKTN